MKKLALIATMILLVVVGGMVFAGGQQEGESSGMDYPKKDITLIIGFGAGGGTDTTGRVFIEALGKQIPGVNLVPTNMAGAGGTVGATHVFNAKPDGYTLFIAHPGIPVPYLKGNFEKTYKDYTPISSFADSSVAMYVSGKSPYYTVADIVADVKAAPNSLIMGVSPGTLIHLASLHVEEENGVSFKKVSIGGGQPTAPELLSGRVDTFLQSISVGAPYVKSGDFRALAVFGSERVAAFPDVPTFQELGLPYTFEQSFGLWAPPETPVDIIAYLSEAIEKACADPEYVEALAVLGVRSGFRATDAYIDLLVESFAELEETAPLMNK